MDQVKFGGLIRNRNSSLNNQWVQASDSDTDSDSDNERSPCSTSTQYKAVNKNNNNVPEKLEFKKSDSESDDGVGDRRHVRPPLANATGSTGITDNDLSCQFKEGSGERVASFLESLGRLPRRPKEIRSGASSKLTRKIQSEVDGFDGGFAGRLIRKKKCSLLSASNGSHFDNDHDGDVDNSDDDDCSSSSNFTSLADGNVDSSCRTEYLTSTSKYEQGKPVFVRSRRMQHNGQQEAGGRKQDCIGNFDCAQQLDEPNSQEINSILANSYHKLGKKDGSMALKNDRADSRSGSVFRKPILFLKNTLSISSSQGTLQSTSSTNTRDIILNDRKKYMAQADMPSSDNNYQTIQILDEPQSYRRKSSGTSRLQRSSSINGYTKLNQQQQYYQTRFSKRPTLIQELLRLLLLLLIIVVSCFLLWKLYIVLIDDYNYLGAVDTPSELGVYRQYAVSTDAEPCAKVGEELLAKGGSAVDASIGTLLCMGVVLPNSLGLGGGCLMTLYDAKKNKTTVIDGREVAPDYASENMFANDSLKASRGPLSVGVPGELAAYWKAHQMFGKLAWSELFNRSIDMAENGVPTVEHLSYALRQKSHAKYISPMMAKFFLNNKTGEYVAEGELLVQKELANTLRRVRDFGAKEFYGGLTGQNFIKDLEMQGGKITLENMIKYEALVREPITIKLDDDLLLHTQPPPGSGIVLSIILRIMKKLGYYKNLKPQTDFNASSAYYHKLTEAFKFAYGQRAALEDQPDPKLMERLMSDDFIGDAVSKIDDFAHDNSHYGAMQYFSEDHGTAHVSVLDAGGNAAAITTSVNLYFGSGLISPSTGIIYNDVMDDFVSPKIVNKFGLAPTKANRIRPGMRPLSSMAPSVFTDNAGNVKLIIGGSGGSKITTSIASVCIRNCFLGEDIKTAIDGPRIHHQFLPNSIFYENNFPRDILQSLVDRGHSTRAIVGRSSVIMAIASDQKNGTRYITANSDYRKGGSVAGL